MTALEAALAYARLGWRVHPCEPGGKRPLLRDWPAKATADPAIIRSWWRPDANLAVATGEESGLFVLDVDGPEGERTLVDLERRHGPLPDLYPQQSTGGGRAGWQAFFAWPEGREIRNSAGRLGAKLDTRGEGGYVLAPPSVTTEAYRWAEDRDPWTLPLEPAPGWLLDLLDPLEPERPAWTPGAYQSADNRTERYALRALEAELAMVAASPTGRRNDQLNASAHALFRLVVDGRLDRGVIADGLAAAARHAGLADREILATLASAARARGLS